MVLDGMIWRMIFHQRTNCSIGAKSLLTLNFSHMKTHISYIIIIAIILIFTIDCNGRKGQTVKLPERKGKTSIAPPKTQTVARTVTDFKRVTDTVDLTDKERAKYESELERVLRDNDSAYAYFMKANDSLQAEIYKRSIEPKYFYNVLNDSLVKIETDGIVRGNIESTQIRYTLKPRTASIQPQRAIIIGAMARMYEKTLIVPNIAYKARNGFTYTLGYDTDKKVWIGISRDLIKF